MWMMIVNLMINGLAWFAMYWCVLCTLSLSAFALCIRFAFAMHGIDVPSVLGIFVGKLCTYTHGWTAWPERCQVCGIAGELKCFGVSQLSCSNMSTTYCLNKMINNHNRKWKGTAKSKHSPNNPQLAVSVTSLSNLYIYLYIYIYTRFNTSIPKRLCSPASYIWTEGMRGQMRDHSAQLCFELVLRIKQKSTWKRCRTDPVRRLISRHSSLVSIKWANRHERKEHRSDQTSVSVPYFFEP